MLPLNADQKQHIISKYDQNISTLTAYIENWDQVVTSFCPEFTTLIPDEQERKSFFQQDIISQELIARLQKAKEILEQLKTWATGHPEGKYLPVPDVYIMSAITTLNINPYCFMEIYKTVVYKSIHDEDISTTTSQNANRSLLIMYNNLTQHTFPQAEYISEIKRCNTNESFSIPLEWKKDLLAFFVPYEDATLSEPHIRFPSKLSSYRNKLIKNIKQH